MHTEKLHLDDIRYNPELGAFEALIRIHDAGTIYSYPVYAAAPLHAEFGFIARSLAEKAQRKHRSTEPGLRAQMPQPAWHAFQPQDKAA